MFKRFLKEDESGSLTVAYVCGFILFALLLMLVIEFGSVFAIQQSQSSDLDVARQETLGNAFGFELKNSSTPGRYLSDHIVESLRNNGVDGNIDIYYAEATASQVPSNKRAIAYQVVVEKRYEPSLGSTIIDSFPVRSTVTCSLVPYSSDTAWRPTSGGVFMSENGRFSYPAGANTPSFTSMNVSSMPNGLQDALNQAIDEAQ